MKKSVLILGALSLAGLAAYKGVKAANAVQLLKVELKKIKWVSTSVTQTTMAVTLSVYNPTNTSVSFDRLYAQVKVNGGLLGEMDIAGGGKSFTALQTTELVVPLLINHFSTLSNLVSIVYALKNRQPINKPFDVTGTLYAANLQVPFSQSLNLSDYIPKPAQIVGVRGCKTCTV